MFQQKKFRHDSKPGSSLRKNNSSSLTLYETNNRTKGRTRNHWSQKQNQEISQELKTLKESCHDSSWRNLNGSFSHITIQRLKEGTQHREFLQAPGNSREAREVSLNRSRIAVFIHVFHRRHDEDHSSSLFFNISHYEISHRTHRASRWCFCSICCNWLNFYWLNFYWLNFHWKHKHRDCIFWLYFYRWNEHRNCHSCSKVSRRSDSCIQYDN